MHPPNQSSCFHLFIVFNLECNENQWNSRPLKTQDDSLKIEWLLWYFCWCQRIEVYNNDTLIIRKGWKVTLTLHFLSPLSWISWASWQLARWPQQRTVATSSQVLPWTVRAVPAFLLLFILVSTLLDSWHSEWTEHILLTYSKGSFPHLDIILLPCFAPEEVHFNS